MNKGKIEKAGKWKNLPTAKMSLLLICASFVLACQPNSSIISSQKNAQTANTPDKVSSPYERDLETMKTANFDTILVIRRKDGGALDAEDKKYIKTYSPMETNRFIVTDGEKAVIAGSKFRFPPENIDILRERFAVENLSKPVEEASPANIPANGNVNSNVNNGANTGQK
ncbi:MAG: hypothetical protein JWN60_1276 [Acidobacteria bacterium]|jgi:hypothetical protein|nr:hypothetical protein [Acidobacteriota bacterium]